MDYKYLDIDRVIWEKVNFDNELNKSELFYTMLLLNQLSYSMLWKLKENDEDKIVRKRVQTITELTGSKATAVKIINYITDNGLAERGRDYKIGEYSKGFIPKMLPTGKFTRLVTSKYLGDAQAKKFKNRMENKKDKTIQWHLNNLIKMLKLDLTKTSKYLKTRYDITVTGEKREFIQKLDNLDIDTMDHLTQEQKYQLAFDRLKIKELANLKNTDITKGLKGGRHYHALTNASRGLKSCMISKSKEKQYLWQLDLKNSQPFFLLCLIQQKGLKIEEHIKASILGGTFYETLGKVWGYNEFEVMENHEVRKEVKEKVYRDIFFCKSNAIRRHLPGFKKIQKKYPQFCAAIQVISNVKQRTLASLLQEIETDELLPITKGHHAVGIHDAILTVTVKNSDEIEKIKADIFNHFKNKYGITPSISVDLISFSGENEEAENPIQEVEPKEKAKKEKIVVNQEETIGENEEVNYIDPGDD